MFRKEVKSGSVVWGGVTFVDLGITIAGRDCGRNMRVKTKSWDKDHVEMLEERTLEKQEGGRRTGLLWKNFKKKVLINCHILHRMSAKKRPAHLAVKRAVLKMSDYRNAKKTDKGGRDACM